MFGNYHLWNLRLVMQATDMRDYCRMHLWRQGCRKSKKDLAFICSVHCGVTTRGNLRWNCGRYRSCGYIDARELDISAQTNASAAEDANCTENHFQTAKDGPMPHALYVSSVITEDDACERRREQSENTITVQTRRVDGGLCWHCLFVCACGADSR